MVPMRKSVWINELLPAPVRPTMPIFSAGLIDKEMRLSASDIDEFVECDMETLSKMMRPCVGQLDGGEGRCGGS